MADPSKKTDEPVTQAVQSALAVIGSCVESDDFPADKLAQIRDGYCAFSMDEKKDFLHALMTDIEIEPDDVKDSLQRAVSIRKPGKDWTFAVSDLRKGLQSPRERLFRQFMKMEDGLPFLLSVRRDLLSIQRHSSLDLKPVDRELSGLFNTWFQHGFLSLQEVTPASPYRLIQELHSQDMVHPMTRLEEMGQRLGADRRCFVLFHRAMPERPIVFIEVALTIGMARTVDAVIGDRTESTEGEPDTAVFYSINNTQEGLAGIGLGKVLIFWVVDRIRKDSPEIENFVTLSPLPGFWKRYLRRILTEEGLSFELTRDAFSNEFSDRARKTIREAWEAAGHDAPEHWTGLLVSILDDGTWNAHPTLVKYLERPLVNAAYIYLMREKSSRGRPINPVANFHLNNGATLSKRHINYLGNPSERGMKESCGLMVNYVYTQTWFRQVSRSIRSWFGWQRG